MKTDVRVERIILLIVGLVVVGMTVFGWVNLIRVNNYTGMSDGIVVDLVEHVSTERSKSGRRRVSCTYSPVVEFVAQDGSVIRSEYSVSSNPPAYREGDSVIVKYDENNPEHWVIKGDWSYWLFAIIPTIFVVVFGWIMLRRKVIR